MRPTLHPKAGDSDFRDKGGLLEQNTFKSSNSDPPPVFCLAASHVMLAIVVIVVVVIVEGNDGATLASHEEEEESIFILSFRLAITSSCSRSNNNVCACDAGIFLQ